MCIKLLAQCSAPGRMRSQQVLVPLSFPSPSGVGFIAPLLKNLHPANLGVDSSLGSSEPSRWLSYETSLPQTHSCLSHLLDVLLSSDLAAVVEVADKLVFCFCSHIWFVYKIHIHKIYFFCKDFVTEPKVQSCFWSSSHITLLCSETFPEHILFQLVSSAGTTFPLSELPLLFSARLTSDKWQSHTLDCWVRVHFLLFCVQPAYPPYLLCL